MGLKGVIFNKAVINCITASQLGQEQGCRAAALWGSSAVSARSSQADPMEGKILVLPEAASQDEVCSVQGWAPLAGRAVCCSQYCCSNSQAVVQTSFSYFVYASMPNDSWQPGSKRRPKSGHLSSLLHQPLFPCLNSKLDMFFGWSVPLEWWLALQMAHGRNCGLWGW